MATRADLSLCLDVAPGPALLVSADGVVLAANSRMGAAWGLGPGASFEGDRLESLLGEAARGLLAEAAATGRTEGELVAARGDGALAELRYCARALEGAAGAPEGALVVSLVDVTAARRLERAAEVLGRGLDAGPAESFFDRLAAGLATALKMEMALVGRLEPGEPERVRTLAVHAAGAPGEPFTYDLHGAPCERVVGREPCVFACDVARLFPEDRVLAERSFASYAGVPLGSPDGRPLGLLAALSTRPLHDGASVARALGLFAGRAAAEIERREARLVEEKLEAESRRLLASIPVGLHRWRLEEDGRLLFAGANPAADTILGVDHRELLGLPIEEAFPALAGSAIPEAYRRVAGEGVGWGDEEVVYADGRIAGAFLVKAFPTAAGEMAAAFLDITDRRRAEEALRERESHLERLNRILRSATRVREILAEARETGELVGRVCAALVEDRGYAFAWVGLLDEGGNEVRLAGASGPCDPETFRIDLRTLHGGTGCGRTAFLRGAAVLIDAGADDPGCVECPRRRSHEDGPALAVPLWRGDQTLGVLVVEGSATGAFDAEESRLVADLADDLAAAIDRLDGEAQRAEAARARRFRAAVGTAALSETGPAALLAPLAAAVEARLEADGVLLALWDDERRCASRAEGRGVLAPAAWDLPALARALAPLVAARAEHGGAVRLSTGIEATAWPLRDGARTLGVLAVAREGPAGRGAVDAGSEATGPVALALAKARLAETDRERVATLLALHETGVDLGSSREGEALVRSIVERARALVRGSMAGLYLARPDGKLELVLADGRLAASVGILLSPGEGVAGTVAATREPLLLEDYEAWPGRARVFAASGIGSVVGVPVLWRGDVLGALFVEHDETGRFRAADVETVRLFAEQAAVAIANSRLIDDLKRAAGELAEAYDATLEGWVRALDLRDSETEGHTQRVVEATVDLARRAGVPEEALVHVRRGALLHDIGKVGIPDRILQKPGPLTGEEWAVMRRHPQYAHDVLSGIAFLRPALDIPWAHHEKWDGSGYPRGLRGEEIPLAARAFAVVDIWDALVSDRPYRKAVPEEAVRAYLGTLRGTHLDARLVDLFLEEPHGA